MDWALCCCELVPAGALAGSELLRAGLGDGAPSCLWGTLSHDTAAGQRGLYRPHHSSQRQPGNEFAALGIFIGPPPGLLPRWDCIVWRVQKSG
jgi:hypothetical protein